MIKYKELNQLEYKELNETDRNFLIKNFENGEKEFYKIENLIEKYSITNDEIMGKINKLYWPLIKPLKHGINIKIIKEISNLYNNAFEYLSEKNSYKIRNKKRN